MHKLERKWRTSKAIAQLGRSRAVVACGCLVLLTAAPRVGLAGFKEDFVKLEAELAEAEEAYYAAMEVEESAPDGRLPVLAKMDRLADAARGKPDGAHIAIQTLASSLFVDLAGNYARFERASMRYPQEPGLAEVLPDLAWVYPESSTREKWIAALDALEKRTRVKDIRAAALQLKGVVLLEAKRFAEAKPLFQSVVKIVPGSDPAKLAERYLFEIDHLQIGMVAPDFEATSLDGKPVSLKSLRGKTVLLNFWATW